MKRTLLACLAAVTLSCSDPAGPNTATLIVENLANSPVEFFIHVPCTAVGIVPTERIQGNLIAPGTSRGFAVKPDCYDTGMTLLDGRIYTLDAVVVGANESFTITITN